MKALQTYAHCLHAKHTIPKKPTNCKKKKKKLNEYDTHDKRGELVKEKERQKRAHTLRRLEIVPVSRQVLPFPAFRAFRASRRSSFAMIGACGAGSSGVVGIDVGSTRLR